jgi:hypothetical protein
VPQHPNQPAVVNGIEKGSDVEIEHPVRTLRHQRLFQGSQGRMWAAPRPETVAEAYKVGLVDGIQHFGYRALDNLVLERWYADRPTAAVAFGMYVRRTGFGQYCPLWTRLRRPQSATRMTA